jgi:hypothetical protein
MAPPVKRRVIKVGSDEWAKTVVTVVEGDGWIRVTDKASGIYMHSRYQPLDILLATLAHRVKQLA